MVYISSFNAHSVRGNSEIVKNLMSDCDIVLLQELMLPESEVGFLGSLNDNFSFSASVKDKRKGEIVSGRPTGGVAIMWRKTFDKYVTAHKIDERVNYIILKFHNSNILILNLYMPCDYRDHNSLHEYISYIAIINDIINQADIDSLIIAGDLNADHKKSTRFWKEFLNLINEFNLFHVTSVLNNDDFTYLCPSSSSTSFLDHVMCSKNLTDRISDIKIGYEYCIYDHFPVFFILVLNKKLIISWIVTKMNTVLTNNVKMKMQVLLIGKV